MTLAHFFKKIPKFCYVSVTQQTLCTEEFNPVLKPQ